MLSVWSGVKRAARRILLMNAQVLRVKNFSKVQLVIWWPGGGVAGGAPALLFISDYSRENTADLKLLCGP